MVAYSFKARFALDVATGKKMQTIRTDRKRHARAGEPVQLYTGMRTKACRKLIDPDPICVLSTYCAVRPDGITLGDHPPMDRDEFARADGFADWQDMLAFFCPDGKEFVGRLIRWEPSPLSPRMEGTEQ